MPDREVDIAVSHPRDGHMQLVSRYFFADPGAENCRQFIEKIFEVDEVRAVEILASPARAHIEYTNGAIPCREVVGKISRHLRTADNGRRAPYVNSLLDLPVALAGGAAGWRVERHGPLLSTWEIKHELPGRIRLRNRLIHRKADRCGAIDRALAQAVGVDRHTTNPRTATVLILYDPRKVQRDQLIRLLDQALVDAEREAPGDSAVNFPVCTVSLGLAAASQFLAPSVLPFMLLELAILGGALSVFALRATTKWRRHGAAHDDPAELGAPGHASDLPAAHQDSARERPWSKWAFTIGGLSLGASAIGDAFYPPLSLLSVPAAAHTTRGVYVSGFRSLARERRLTVDMLLVCVNALNLMAGHFFLFSLTTFAFLCTRSLLDRVKQDSRADYTDIFRQQARTVWVRVEGVDVETPLDAVRIGDLVSIEAGQTVPVDGRIAEGAAAIDQHLLTGEAMPADKGVGDTVFALTVVLSGRISVRVEKTGAATAAAHIARVLQNTVDFKTGRQLRAEQVADRLVGPAFVAGLLAWPLFGPGAGAAMLDAHPKYKTTLASSLALLNYFKLAARHGLLIKDGRTLELLNRVDTVVFDKTGTLTLGQPHVRRVHACAPHAADDILRLAAAAEQHQSHPIAKAIVHIAGARGLSVPPVHTAEYKAGYGLTVTLEQRRVCVGSMRLIEMEGIVVPPAVVDLQARCHRESHALVLVALDGDVVGAIELHTTIRPEAKRIVEGLRRRHITSMYIISGDHEAPTAALAETLGIEHFFAETLPENKAALIEQLRQAGRVVCYVGDGINDSIAMRTSHVSVSLRGASTLATDTAEVILLDESLNQLCRLFDIARECQSHTTMTMAAVFIPSLVCVGGIVLFNFAFAQARLLNVVGLLTGVGAAMLPLLTHRSGPAPTDGPGPADRRSADLPIEVCVVQ